MAGDSELLWIMAVAAAGLFDGITTHMALSTGKFDELNWWPRWLYQRCSPVVFVALHAIGFVVIAVISMMLVPSAGVTPCIIVTLLISLAGGSNLYQLWILKKKAQTSDL